MASADSQVQCVSFNTLPFELRRQIWLETLTPRLIFLHPYQRFSPPPYEAFDDCRTLSVQFLHLSCDPSTIPAEAFATYASSADPNHGYLRCPSTDGARPDCQIVFLEPSRYKSTTSPAALYVSRESRAIAVARGYTLAFKGVDAGLKGADKAYWERNNLSHKGIWIDFDRDLLMVNTLCQDRDMPNKPNGIYELKPLIVLSETAPDEVRRIKRIISISKT